MAGSPTEPGTASGRAHQAFCCSFAYQLPWASSRASADELAPQEHALSITTSRDHAEPGTLSLWQSLSPWEKAVQLRKTAPGIADQVISLASDCAEKAFENWQEQSRVDIQLSIQAQNQRERMERRAWWLELLLTIGALLGMLGSIALSWKYASSGHVFSGLAALGGGGVTAGCVYATGSSRALRKTRPRSDPS
jgi:hypothetical protein